MDKNAFNNDQIDLQKRLQVMTQRFEIEKDCKNQAYFFIISSGLLKQYEEYCQVHPVGGADYHAACVAKSYIDSLAEK